MGWNFFPGIVHGGFWNVLSISNSIRWLGWVSLIFNWKEQDYREKGYKVWNTEAIGLTEFISTLFQNFFYVNWIQIIEVSDNSGLGNWGSGFSRVPDNQGSTVLREISDNFVYIYCITKLATRRNKIE